MTTNDPGYVERAADTLTDVRTAARNAGETIESLSDRFTASTIPQMVAEMTRSAPLAMLGVAFVLGAMFAAGRRR